MPGSLNPVNGTPSIRVLSPLQTSSGSYVFEPILEDQALLSEAALCEDSLRPSRNSDESDSHTKSVQASQTFFFLRVLFSTKRNDPASDL